MGGSVGRGRPPAEGAGSRERAGGGADGVRVGEVTGGGGSKATLGCVSWGPDLAAWYLDGGIEGAMHLMLQSMLAAELERLNASGYVLLVTDYKYALQEHIQASAHQHLSYTVVGEDGPAGGV